MQVETEGDVSKPPRASKGAYTGQLGRVTGQKIWLPRFSATKLSQFHSLEVSGQNSEVSSSANGRLGT